MTTDLTAETTLATGTRRRASATVIRPYDVEPLSDWTVRRVKRALEEHERGDFGLSGRLIDAFGRDDRITACVQTRVKAVTSKAGLSFSVEPSTVGPKARNAKLAKQVDRWWFSALPESTQARILRDGVLLGVSISRVTWSRGAEWIPSVSPWPMQEVSWDSSAQMYATNTRELGRVFVDPEDPNWLVYTPYGYERAWMGGLVRCLGLLFVLRQLSWRDWARFCERHGMPIIVIREPSEYPEEDKERFARAVADMGRDGVLRLTQAGPDGATGFDLEFAEPKDTSWESFQGFQAAVNASIAIVLLGQNLTTEVQGGSFAAAKVQDRVRADYLASDTESLSTTFRSELIEPWLDANHGYPAEQAPWPTWESATPGDRNAVANAYKTSGEAVQALRAAEVNVDWDALAERLELPMAPGPAIDEGPDDDVQPPGVPVPPSPSPADAPGGADADPDDQALALASGDDATGFRNGQRYIDALVETGTAAAQDALQPTVDVLLAIVANAESYQAALDQIVALYRNLDTRELEIIAERLVILSELSGRAAVVEDL